MNKSLGIIFFSILLGSYYIAFGSGYRDLKMQYNQSK